MQGTLSFPLTMGEIKRAPSPLPYTVRSLFRIITKAKRESESNCFTIKLGYYLNRGGTMTLTYKTTLSTLLQRSSDSEGD